MRSLALSVLRLFNDPAAELALNSMFQYRYSVKSNRGKSIHKRRKFKPSHRNHGGPVSRR